MEIRHQKNTLYKYKRDFLKGITMAYFNIETNNTVRESVLNFSWIKVMHSINEAATQLANLELVSTNGIISEEEKIYWEKIAELEV